MLHRVSSSRDIRTEERGCCGGVYNRHMYGCYRHVLPRERRGLQPVTTVHGQASWCVCVCVCVCVCACVHACVRACVCVYIHKP